MKRLQYIKPQFSIIPLEETNLLISSESPLQINVYKKTGNRIQLGKENDFIFQEDEDFPDADFFIPNEIDY